MKVLPVTWIFFGLAAASVIPLRHDWIAERNAEALAADSYGADAFSSLDGRSAIPPASSGYAPSIVACPATRPSIRDAKSGLSPQELAWLSQRRKATIPAMQAFLGRMNIGGFDANAYFATHASDPTNMPVIGIAVSGGGYRAMTNGAGHLKAWDSREAGSTDAGALGGLLQSTTYLSGLSGGSWLVGSVMLNQFSTISALTQSTVTWNLTTSLLEGPSRSGFFGQVSSTAAYYTLMIKQILTKKTEGFPVGITDLWGRALSQQFIDAPDGGPGVTWSSLARDPTFSSGQAPLPIVVADARGPGETLLNSRSTTIFEFTPWELGTSDPTVSGFVPLQYLGTKFNGGTMSSGSCISGFDNAGFVMGTSSSLFNQILLRLQTGSFPDLLRSALNSLLASIVRGEYDIASYTPNPFLGFNAATAGKLATNETLTLVDGGEDGQVIPFAPLLAPARAVDVIFAIDSSGDTATHWPNGSDIVATYERSLEPIANGVAFPAVPDVNTFVNLGLNARPTFFGCDAKNTSKPAPLIVYLPNAPYLAWTNTSTFLLSYNQSFRDAMIENGYAVATMNHAQGEADWPSCVGCAVLSRSFDRTQTAVPDACAKCFAKYCWDGSYNTTVPMAYSPPINSAPTLAMLAGVNNGTTTNVGSPVAVNSGGVWHATGPPPKKEIVSPASPTSDS